MNMNKLTSLQCTQVAIFPPFGVTAVCLLFDFISILPY